MFSLKVQWRASPLLAIIIDRVSDAETHESTAGTWIHWQAENALDVTFCISAHLYSEDSSCSNVPRLQVVLTSRSRLSNLNRVRSEKHQSWFQLQSKMWNRGLRDEGWSSLTSLSQRRRHEFVSVSHLCACVEYLLCFSVKYSQCLGLLLKTMLLCRNVETMYYTVCVAAHRKFSFKTNQKKKLLLCQ